MPHTGARGPRLDATHWGTGAKAGWHTLGHGGQGWVPHTLEHGGQGWMPHTGAKAGCHTHWSTGANTHTHTVALVLLALVGVGDGK